MKKDILLLLEQNARISIEEISIRLGLDIVCVAEAIDEMINENVICGYNTLINWDKIDNEHVTALVEVKVTPQRGNGFDSVAKYIYNFDEVKSVYLMSGVFDLTVILEGKSMKEIAYFISNKLSTLDTVNSCATHFILKKYKEHGIILEKNNQDDERLMISP